jgi:hypothetical protein
MNETLPRDEAKPVQWQDPPALRALLFVVAVPLAAFLLDVILAVGFRKLSQEVSTYALKTMVYFFYFAFGIWTAHYFYRFRRPYLLVLIGVIALLALRFAIVTAVDPSQLAQAMLSTSQQAGVIYGAFALSALLFRFTESRLEFAEAKQVVEAVDPFTEKKSDTGTCSRCGLPTVVAKERSLSFLGKSPVYVCSNCNVYLGGNPVNNILLGLTEAVSSVLFIIGAALNMQGQTSSNWSIFLLVLLVGIWDGCRRMSSGFSGIKRRPKPSNSST